MVFDKKPTNIKVWIDSIWIQRDMFYPTVLPDNPIDLNQEKVKEIAKEIFDIAMRFKVGNGENATLHVKSEQKWEGTVIRSLSEARIRINQNIGIDDFNFIQNIYDFILSIIYINAHTEYNENLYDYRINISYDDDENR